MPVDVNSLSPALRQLVVKNGKVDESKLSEVASGKGPYAANLIEEAAALLNGNKAWGQVGDMFVPQTGADMYNNVMRDKKLKEMAAEQERNGFKLQEYKVLKDGVYELTYKNDDGITLVETKNSDNMRKYYKDGKLTESRIKDYMNKQHVTYYDDKGKTTFEGVLQKNGSVYSKRKITSNEEFNAIKQEIFDGHTIVSEDDYSGAELQTWYNKDGSKTFIFEAPSATHIRNLYPDGGYSDQEDDDDFNISYKRYNGNGVLVAAHSGGFYETDGYEPKEEYDEQGRIVRSDNVEYKYYDEGFDEIANIYDGTLKHIRKYDNDSNIVDSYFLAKDGTVTPWQEIKDLEWHYKLERNVGQNDRWVSWHIDWD